MKIGHMRPFSCESLRRLPSAAAFSTLVLLSPLAACGGTGSAPGNTETPSNTIAFVGVTVVPMTETGGVLPDQTVLVRGGRIVAVGPSREVIVPPRSERIDGTGRYLMPGLADMHVHLEYFDDPDVLKLFLANGVTTLRNMDGRPYILEWRRRAAAGELLAPTIYTAGPILDGDPPILSDNTIIRNAADARTAVIAQDSAGYDFVKVYTNLSPEAYQAVLATARERGRPVAGHVPRRVDLGEALTGGQAAIEHLADYGDWIEADSSPFRDRWHWSRLFLAMPIDDANVEAAAERIARSGVWTTPTLIERERAVAPADTVRAWLAAPAITYIPAEGRARWEGRIRSATARMDAADWTLVAQGRANRERLVRALHQAGARLLIGTDTPNPFVVPGFSLLEELNNFVEAGFTPAEALAVATREAARFLGDLDEWGTVEAGKRADLLLVGADPLANIGNVSRRVGVMVRGQWLPEAELQAMLVPLAN